MDALGAWENVDAPGVLGSVFNQVGALGGGEVSKTDWPASKVEMRNVSELVPYANNSRTHSPQQVDQIAASINEWGWTVPVLVDEKGMLIAGHGRIMAAQKLGIDKVPTITVRGWTEAQKKAYVIADNKLALNADWNLQVLTSEIDSIARLDFDISKLGFDDNELSKMFNDVFGVTIDNDFKIEEELESITVKFSPDVKIDVINAVTTAVKDIPSAEVWTGE